MTDSGGPSPASFSGSLRDPDIPILREHFRDVTRWVLGDALGDRLTAGESDALAEEIAVILASGLAPALSGEIEHQAEKTVEALQDGPVSFDHHHQLHVDGFTTPDLVKLLDAVGRLVDADADAGAGVTEAISGLHDTHQRMLYRARDRWLANQVQ